MQFLDDIIAYEQGELTFEEEVTLFKNLASTGLLWGLQGHYQRTYYSLKEEGLLND